MRAQDDINHKISEKSRILLNATTVIQQSLCNFLHVLVPLTI